MGKDCFGNFFIESRDAMSQYEVQIPGSVIDIIDDEDSQRKASSSASDTYITAMPHVTSSVPESTLSYHGPSETMWPLFPGAPSNYLYEVQRMEIFRAMNQQQQQQQIQLPAYPIPSIQYPDYMPRMPSEIPFASQFDELTRSCNVSTTEPYRPYIQPECSSTTQEATLTSAAAAVAAAKLFEAEEQAVTSRKPNCARCRNHDFKVAVKGHKRTCPFRDCECDKCILIKERQVLMKKQLNIKRQHSQRESIDFPAPVQAPIPSGEMSPVVSRISSSTYDITESHLPPIKRRKVIEANAKASLGGS